MSSVTLLRQILTMRQREKDGNMTPSTMHTRFSSGSPHPATKDGLNEAIFFSWFEDVTDASHVKT